MTEMSVKPMGPPIVGTPFDQVAAELQPPLVTA
jgi:hypothetical protein